MRKMIIVVGLVGLMLLSGTYAFAKGPGAGFGQGGGPGPGNCPGWETGHRWGGGAHGHAWEGRGALNLTPDQKTKLQDLRRKFREDNAQLIGSIVAKRIELRSLWTDPKADPNNILQKEKDLRGLQDQMKDKMVQMKLEARKFLTPEQISNWTPGWGMGRGRMMGGRDHMMGMGHGGMGPGMCY